MPIKELADMLDRVHLGGTITECVISINKNIASVQAMDMTSTVFVHTTAEFDHEDDQWGIGNLPLFIKYLRSYQDRGLTITRKENRLVMKPEKGSTVKYLTSQVDLIPTFDAEWIDAPPVDELMKKFDGSLVMAGEAVSEFINLMRLFSLNTVRLTVNPKGRVFFQGGTENEHQFDVNFGISKMAECDIKIYGKHLMTVISAVEGYDDAKLHLDQIESAVIEIPEATWVIGQIKDA